MPENPQHAHAGSRGHCIPYLPTLCLHIAAVGFGPECRAESHNSAHPRDHGHSLTHTLAASLTPLVEHLLLHWHIGHLTGLLTPMPLHAKHCMWKCLSCTLSTSPVQFSPHESHVMVIL
jgi:hypothetical protein